MTNSKHVGPFEVSFEAVKGESVPVPQRPKNTENETGYVSEELSPAQKEDLKKGVRFFYVMSMMGGQFFINQASKNMKNYWDGTGDDISLSSSDLAELEEFSVGKPKDKIKIITILDAFKELVKQDFKGKASQAYLALNKSEESEDRKNWFGASATKKESVKWYYAVGMFYVTYSAYLSRSGKTVTLKYSMHVYDRYNWNHQGDITYPEPAGEIFAKGKLMSPLQNIQAPNGKPYVFKENGRYHFNNEMMGSLQELQGAKPFDIWGSGRERVEIYVEE